MPCRQQAKKSRYAAGTRSPSPTMQAAMQVQLFTANRPPHRMSSGHVSQQSPTRARSAVESPSTSAEQTLAAWNGHSSTQNPRAVTIVVQSSSIDPAAACPQPDPASANRRANAARTLRRRYHEIP